MWRQGSPASIVLLGLRDRIDVRVSISHTADSQALVAETLARARSAVNEPARQLVSPLTSYDCRHGGDLTHTLTTYLHEGYNTSRAAKRLHLHRSGLLYRLARIRELLQLDLNEYEVRVALELALLGTACSGVDCE